MIETSRQVDANVDNFVKTAFELLKAAEERLPELSAASRTRLLAVADTDKQGCATMGCHAQLQALHAKAEGARGTRDSGPAPAVPTRYGLWQSAAAVASLPCHTP